METFGFLVGISPWWWVAFGVVLGALEMATMSFFMIWPALAAVVMALGLVFWPDLSGEVQVAAFAILAVVLTFLGRGLLNRYGDAGGPESDLNDRASQMIGRHAVVADFTGPKGHVTIDGIRWAARWPAGEMAAEGDRVEVTDADGMVLQVSSG